MSTHTKYLVSMSTYAFLVEVNEKTNRVSWAETPNKHLTNMTWAMAQEWIDRNGGDIRVMGEGIV